jgi:hypothetical protein
MKILITENKFKNMVNKFIGYDLSDRIEMITNWIELGPKGRELFGRDDFRWLLNHYGPMYLFNINNEKYLVQYQGNGNDILVLSYEKKQNINEREFLKIIGIDMLGIGLGKIIDEFIEE